MKRNDVNSLPYILEDTYILQFGTFYFFESFVVSEIKENISFDRKMAQMIIDLIDNHYGKGEEIGYISNRTNKYSVSARAWYKFFEMRYRFKAFVIVNKSKTNPFLCFFKRLFYKSFQCKYDNLLEAASWLTSLHVIKKRNKLLYSQLKMKTVKDKNYFL